MKQQTIFKEWNVNVTECDETSKYITYTLRKIGFLSNCVDTTLCYHIFFVCTKLKKIQRKKLRYIYYGRYFYNKCQHKNKVRKPVQTYGFLFKSQEEKFNQYK